MLLALGLLSAQPFVSRGIDASHHSPVFLEQLQGLLNLEGKESERERESCTLHQSVVLTVLLGNGVVRSCCKMGLQRRRQGPGLETQEETGFLQTRSCGLLHAVEDVGSNPGCPLSSLMTLKDGCVPRGLGPPSLFPEMGRPLSSWAGGTEKCRGAMRTTASAGKGPSGERKSRRGPGEPVSSLHQWWCLPMASNFHVHSHPSQ